jgi:hypothetical protein
MGTTSSNFLIDPRDMASSQSPDRSKRDHLEPAAYAHAFAIALACNVAFLALGGVLSQWLRD